MLNIPDHPKNSSLSVADSMNSSPNKGHMRTANKNSISSVMSSITKKQNMEKTPNSKAGVPRQP
jgi:hypothetical protein